MRKFLFGVIASLSLFACSTTNEKPALEKIELSTNNELPEEFINTFITSSNEACIKNGNNFENCNCYSNEIIDTFTVNDFTKVINALNNSENIETDPEINEKIVKASIKCFGEN